MSDSEIVLLGAIAGFTIFLGLPIGRLENPMPAFRAFLNAIAVGILIFLLWDVLSAGIEPVETLTRRRHERRRVVVALRRLQRGADRVPDRRAGHPRATTTGGCATARHRAPRDRAQRRATSLRLHAGPIARLSEPKRLALFIALGIGFHNFSEGLAIGQSAASGEISLALLLIIGFGLHNATEGFGIVAPIAAEGERPSWAFLGLMGLIGGGPTFVGTIVGQTWVNEWLFIAFLGLAAGSILYVVIELLGVGRKLGYKELATWGILLGLFLGFATDMVLVAAGT